MSAIQEKIAQAKAAGYSDAQIASHLADSPEYGDKIKTAAAAGYKPEEIVSHLASAPAPQNGGNAVATPSAGKSLVDGVSGFAAGAGAGFGKLVLGAQRFAGKGLVALGGATT